MGIEHRLHSRCGSHGHEHHEHAAAGQGAARPFAFGGSPRHFERARPFTVEHLALDVTLDLPNKTIHGTASLTIVRIDPEANAIELDAIAFTVSAVTYEGKATPFTYDGRTISVTIPEASPGGVLVVTYRATPRKGLYFLEPDEHVPTRPRQVWSQCQEEDARHFFPCHDKPHVKMTTEARVSVPEGFYVLSNGELVDRSRASGQEIFHWKMNDRHPSYLVTIVAGEFAELTDSVDVGGRRVPLTYLVPKGREADGTRTFAKTGAMITLFSERTGAPYPWNKYAQVVVADFIFGGMENTTATTMYEHLLLDERAAIDITGDDLIAHELAHQWFGDLLTYRDWSEGWLAEGFATFFEAVWFEHDLGRDEYDYGVRGFLSSYTGEARGRYRRPIVCADYDAPLDLFDRHLYEKGAVVLHVLRTELGDTLFWKGVAEYVKRHANGIVETRDLLRAFEDVSGRSLGRRFEELLYKPGHAELDVELGWEDGVLRCNVKQTQAATDGVPSAFEIVLVLAIDEGGKTRQERVKLASRTDSFAIPCPKRPSFVVVDPELRILGEVHVRAPADMLRAQLAGAKTARGRWLAAQALARSDDPVTIEALATRLADDAEFWGVRAEAAEALAHIRARECFEALVASRDVAHPKVRRAVVAALGAFRTTAAAVALKPRALRDASYLVEAEAARSLGKTRQGAAYDVLLDVLDRPSWAGVIGGAAIDGLANLRDERALPHLFARTRYGHASRIRRAAALAIPKLATDRRAREHLEDLLDDGDAILRIDVVRALADLGDARSRSALRARSEIDLDPRVRRRIKEVVRDLGGERKQAEHMKEEFEKLQHEHADLKARVGKLEARFGEVGDGGRSPKAHAVASKGAPKTKPAPKAKAKRAHRGK